MTRPACHFRKDFGERDAEDGADDAGDGEVRDLRLPGVFFFQRPAQFVDGDHLIVDQVGEAAEGVLAAGGALPKIWSAVIESVPLPLRT